MYEERPEPPRQAEHIEYRSIQQKSWTKIGMTKTTRSELWNKQGWQVLVQDREAELQDGVPGVYDFRGASLDWLPRVTQLWPDQAHSFVRVIVLVNS